MADIIGILPDSVANQIAAGEVIQRPASVIKELVENAVDAKASCIEVIVKNAGRTLIEVIDNGIGMSETDARLCFERHATSKIKSADDLFHLHTKGFRGEALASIAAIAQVELKTKRKEDDLGTKIMIEGCKCTEQSACSCENGTAFLVKNLFFNVPARRNFLKSDNVEFGHIQDEFLRIALVHRQIHFKLYHNEKLEYNLPPASMKQRIVAVFGTHYNEKLIPIEQKNDIVEISGYITKPEHARKTKGEQYLFVNERFIKHSYFHHAIVSAFEQLIPEKTFPGYFIYLNVKPESIDINIHPTKTEVKFQEEQFIYKILHSAIKHSLGTFNLSSSIDFENSSPFDFSNMKSTSTDMPTSFSNPEYNPFDSYALKQDKSSTSTWQAKTSVRSWENLYESIQENNFGNTENQQHLFEQEQENSLNDSSGSVFQIGDQYIVGKVKSGIVLINISHAMERIFFERYCKRLEKENHYSCQKLLFPETLNFSPQNAETMKDLLPDFLKLGFDIEEFGKNTFIINGIPSDVSIDKIQDFIDQLIETYNNNLLSLKISKKHNLAHAFACSTFRKLNKKNLYSQEEMQSIIQELFMTSSPEISPSGKKICVIITEKELWNMFN